MNNKINIEINEEMLKMFNEKCTIKSIAKKFNIDRKKLSKAFKEKGYFIKNNQNAVSHLSVDDYLDIQAMYKEGKTIEAISKIEHVSAHFIKKYLFSINIISEESKPIDSEIFNLYFKEKLNAEQISKELLIPYSEIRNCFNRNHWIFRNSGRIHIFDEKKFDIIDSHEKAYWLGFLFGDGYNSTDNGNVELTLEYEDKAHLEKFLLFMKAYDTKIVPKIVKLNGKEFLNNRVILSSKYLSKRLSEIGCVQAKSLIVRFPKERYLSEKYQCSFIAGYFDANGSIGCYDNNWRAGVYSGSENMLKDIKNILENKYKVIKNGKVKNRCKEETKHSFGYTFSNKNNLDNLYEFAYTKIKNFTYLDRKYFKFKEVHNQIL